MGKDSEVRFSQENLNSTVLPFCNYFVYTENKMADFQVQNKMQLLTSEKLTACRLKW